MTNNYVPRNDAAFYEWAVNIVSYSAEHHQRWLICSMDAEIETRLAHFKKLVDKCNSSTRSKVDTLDKNEMRKAIEKDMRGYVQGFVIRNPYVTDADRQLMRLPIYATHRTHIGTPAGLVTATVKYLHECALELLIRHVEGTPFDRRANYGVRILHGVLPAETPSTISLQMLNQSVFTRRKKYVFYYSKEDVRKTACFCLMYESRKGEAGQWGQIITAVIP